MTEEEANKLVQRDAHGYIIHDTVPDGFVVVPSLLGPRHSRVRNAESFAREMAAAASRSE